MNYQLISIQPSTNKNKKLKAIFYNLNTKRYKTVHFGAKNMEDYTIHKNNERKKNYILRHQVNEDWTNPIKAGTLSRYILWEKKDINDAINNYIKKFNL